MPPIPVSQVSLLLSVLLVLFFGVVCKKHPSKWRAFILPAIVVAAIISIICRSRACAVSSFIGIAMVFASFSKNPKTILAAMLPTVVLVIGSLYLIRPASANGRVLIWRVCVEMMADKPWGFGWNGMISHYMTYQATFFKNHPGSVFAQYADDIAIAYNEFLHVAVCWGIAGLATFCVMLADVIYARIDHGRNDIIKAAFISCLGFALFSFPFSNVYTWILFWGLFVMADKRYLRKLMNVSGVLVLITGFGYFSIRNTLEHQIDRAETKYGYSLTFDRIANAEKIFKVFPTIANNILHLELFDSSESYDHILDMAIKYVPNSWTYCMKGDRLLDIGLKEHALCMYQEAGYMVPTKLTPKYKEFLVYFNDGNTVEALEKGQEILNMEIKVRDSRAILILKDVGDKISYMRTK